MPSSNRHGQPVLSLVYMNTLCTTLAWPVGALSVCGLADVECGDTE